MRPVRRITSACIRILQAIGDLVDWLALDQMRGRLSSAYPVSFRPWGNHGLGDKG